MIADSDSKNVIFEEPVYREEYYNEWENLSEPPDAGEIDHRNSDSSDFEETYIKKKAKKKEKKVTMRSHVRAHTHARARAQVLL